MHDMTAAAILAGLIERHGGAERWRRVRRIDAGLSSGGLAFTSKLQRSALLRTRASVFPHERRVTFSPFARESWLGEWQPELLRLVDAASGRESTRQDPRGWFSRPSRRWRWDSMDVLYFAGYAIWNYLCFPFLLDDPSVHVTVAEPVRDEGGVVLVATFPQDYPTHSRVQRFHIDAQGLLTRHDYVADVIGTWARAANLCLDSVCIDGLRFYTRRRVVPALSNAHVLPFPTLVWIELGDISVHHHEADAALARSRP